jgi:hypothetical protein
MSEVRELAAEIRRVIDSADVKDPRVRQQLLAAAEAFERQVEEIQSALREWRKDIH